MSSLFRQESINSALVDDLLMASYKGVLVWAQVGKDRWEARTTNLVVRVIKDVNSDRLVEVIPVSGGQPWVTEISCNQHAELSHVFIGASNVKELATFLGASSIDAKLFKLLGDSRPQEESLEGL